MRRETGLGLLAPLAAVLFGAIAVFVVSLLIWAKAVDDDVRGREEVLVARGVRASIAEIERSILPEANWDEAVVNLDHRFNPAWADANLHNYYAQNIDFEHLFVVDGQDRPIYARSHGKTAPVSEFAEFRGAAPLIAKVRAAEAARGPIARRAPTAERTLASRAIQASDFVVRDGKVYLVSATLVQPDFATVVAKGARAPVIVLSLHLDAASLTRLADRFQLTDLRSSLGPAPVAAGKARIVLPTGPGTRPLVLSWTPQTPGAAIARAATLPVGLLLAAFGAVGAVMLARIRKAAAAFVTHHQAQSDFLANMSHEIRTPLNGVNAIATALRRTDLSPAQEEMVGIIQGSGAALERLLSDVLDLSRIETGAVEVASQPFHLADALRSVADMTAARAAEKGLDLIVDIDPAAETVVTGDPVRLKQALANLMSNAVKFTSDGYVALAVRAEPSGVWRIDVQDTGMGFDPAHKARLFDRFQQEDASSTRRHGGAGLGLTIARRLAGLMRGELDATGAPGQGATFTLRLPLTPALVAAPAAPRDLEAPPERPLRILLADDHPTNRKVVQVLFSPFDVDLVCVENGQEACEAFATQRFDLVLMDMQMPVMDGLSAVRTIRERELGRGMARTPIVMLTANALPVHEAASRAAGADLHMAKPIEAPKLFAVLQTVAERQSLDVAA